MTLTISSTKKLNDGSKIPIIGLGMWQISKGKPGVEIIKHALKEGYRLIDTAKAYGNEHEVGEAVRESGIPREDVFVTTKLWNRDHGYDKAVKACRDSLERLGLGYIDLYLIHWPVLGARKETWDALVDLKKQGLHDTDSSGPDEGLECPTVCQSGRIQSLPPSEGAPGLLQRTGNSHRGVRPSYHREQTQTSCASGAVSSLLEEPRAGVATLGPPA
jgi:hypothetical protein